jgi:nucleoside-diphosphate-sugar epimerase
MKILVVGRGWTGNKVYNELLSRGHQTEIINHNDAFYKIIEERYDWVVNCAGVTGSPNVDACELNKEKTYYGNSIYPVLLYKTCKSVETKFAHFSSGCIYSGEITDVYADPNFVGSTYSISKGVSDIYLKNKTLVFRIRMPFTGVDEKKNYLTKVYNYAKTGKLWNGGLNSLTDLDEAVKVACNLIQEGVWGPYNLVNSGSIDMVELAQLMGISPEWYNNEEFAAATKSGRSTCTIPAYHQMSDVRTALKNAIWSLDFVKYQDS